MMVDHMKAKILLAGSKRTVQSCQTIIKKVFLTQLSQFQPIIADKTKEKSTCSLFLGHPLESAIARQQC